MFTSYSHGTLAIWSVLLTNSGSLNIVFTSYSHGTLAIWSVLLNNLGSLNIVFTSYQHVTLFDRYKLPIWGVWTLCLPVTNI